MDLTARPARPQAVPPPPRPTLSEERLKALAADLHQAFAKIAQRRF